MTSPGGKRATQTCRARKPPQREGPGTPGRWQDTRAVCPAPRTAVWRGPGASGQRHLQDAPPSRAGAKLQGNCADPHSHQVRTPGEEGLDLETRPLGQAGRASERSCLSRARCRPSRCQTLLLSRPPPSIFTETTRKRAQRIGVPSSISHSQGVVS